APVALDLALEAGGRGRRMPRCGGEPGVELHVGVLAEGDVLERHREQPWRGLARRRRGGLGPAREERGRDDRDRGACGDRPSHRMRGHTMMHGALEDITKAVGDTPIVRLNKVTKGLPPGVEIYVKCEYLNPGGSHKDR